MASPDEPRLITPISKRNFELYALSLERGRNFDPDHTFSAYQAGWGSTSGCILLNLKQGTFTSLALRRRIDHCWTKVDESGPCFTLEAALDRLEIGLRAGDPPEPLPPGAKRRPLLLKPGPRGTSPEFDLLTTTINHRPALMAIGECYLALPNPDATFVSDFQTSNFPSRLFKLYLLACFREQGLSVRQDHVSPDFLIEKEGDTCWIEAVTANSDTPRAGGIGDWMHAPEDRIERLTGGPAERFAKTLHGKLQCNYHEMGHAKGQSFALALADFHESGSMVWSREACPHTFTDCVPISKEKVRNGAWSGCHGLGLTGRSGLRGEELVEDIAKPPLEHFDLRLGDGGRVGPVVGDDPPCEIMLGRSAREWPGPTEQRFELRRCVGHGRALAGGHADRIARPPGGRNGPSPRRGTPGSAPPSPIILPPLSGRASARPPGGGRPAPPGLT
jgi:hypothetical protein